MSKENGIIGEAVIVGSKGRRNVLTTITADETQSNVSSKATNLNLSHEKCVNDSSVENKVTKFGDEYHGVANPDMVDECDKENHKSEVLVHQPSAPSSSAPSSSSTPHKEWLQTSDHRHLTYDEARSANRAKVTSHYLINTYSDSHPINTTYSDLSADRYLHHVNKLRHYTLSTHPTNVMLFFNPLYLSHPPR